MCKTKLRTFLNNQVKPFEMLKVKLPPSHTHTHTHTHNSNQYQILLKQEKKK
jgi:hypothetical protein